jgi:hypothetical protein
MNAWVEKVKTHLRARWSVSALHDFEDLGSMGGFHYRRDDIDIDGPDSLKDERGWSIFCSYSAHLKSVDEIIRHGQYRHLGDVHEILFNYHAKSAGDN